MSAHGEASPVMSLRSAKPEPERILQLARHLFGYQSLRPGQREAVESVLQGRDTLVVMSTGAGKSAIFELAGKLLGGPTVIISPLIALQRDQLAALEGRGHLVAVALNSTEPARARHEILDRLAGGAGPRPDYVFLGPEQLANGDVLQRLSELRPALVAVDEAHLVSRWGPDFRPDYLRIASAVEAMGRPIVLALTATAAPSVRDEIVQLLDMHDPAVMVRGFGRPNIDLSVHTYFTDDAHKTHVLTEDVVDAIRNQGHGIVYAATHKRVEALAAAWTRRGLRAAGYHAGLGSATRSEIEERFHADDLDVIVATIAFGMGVDKPDIRWVFHADASGSLDEYYQEFGRAGRDGAHADAVLYFRDEDLRLPRMYASSIGPSEASLVAVARALATSNRPTTLADIEQRTKLSRNRTGASAMALVDVGGVTVDADGCVTVVGDLDDAVSKATELVRQRRAIERTRTETMGTYAEHAGCRWQFLLEYFGESTEDRCGHCDNDQRAAADSDDDPVKHPFPRGSRVRHAVFGEGNVIGYAGRGILLDFDRVGYKRLDVRLVMEGDLLEAAP
jgi:ATP-dependent DNA helicase RecQ